MIPPEQIHTSRLLLRKPSLEDAPRIFGAYAQDQAVTKYLLWRPHKSVDDTITFLTACLSSWENNHDFAWAIELQDSGELMGMIGLRVDQTSANLGYVLASSFWNKGFMTEAIMAIADWALRQEGIFRVWAVCDVENIASARVLEKSGMQREGILRRWIVLPNISNEPRDCFCYSKVT
jgi:RimJ/RimL family protein N-acetyltransferase